MLTIFSSASKRLALNVWRVSALINVDRPPMPITLGGWKICSISTKPPLRENNDALQYTQAVLASPVITNSAVSSSAIGLQAVPKSSTNISISEEKNWGTLFALPDEKQAGIVSVSLPNLENAISDLYGKFFNLYLNRIKLSSDEIKSIKTLYIKLIIDGLPLPQSSSVEAKKIVLPNYQDLRDKLDDSDSLAIIPILPRAAMEIGNTKKKAGDNIGYEGFKYLSYLLKKWLGGSPFIITDPTPKENNPFEISDSQGINIDWLIKAGSQEYYNQIIAEKSFKTVNFTALLKKRISEDISIKYNEGEQFWVTVVNEASPYNNMLKKHTMYLQTLRCFEATVISNIKDYVQTSGGNAEESSGISAAFHSFAFHAVLSGKIISVKPEKVDIELNQLAIYFKDSFDFSDKPGESSQPLGTWPSFRTGEPERISLFNSSFQRYRELIGVGGDFYIFSQNKIVSPAERNWDKISFTIDRPGSSQSPDNVKNKP